MARIEFRVCSPEVHWHWHILKGEYHVQACFVILASQLEYRGLYQARMFHCAVMIAQDFYFPEDFLKERRIGDYGRLRKIRWKIKRPARARRIYETSGLNPTDSD
jgi:hypothetical protein